MCFVNVFLLSPDDYLHASLKQQQILWYMSSLVPHPMTCTWVMIQCMYNEGVSVVVSEGTTS